MNVMDKFLDISRLFTKEIYQFKSYDLKSLNSMQQSLKKADSAWKPVNREKINQEESLILKNGLPNKVRI